MTAQGVPGELPTEVAGGLIVLDVDRRTYIGLAHDGTYWHLIRPRRPDERAVVDGTTGLDRIAPGELMCYCAGGQRHGKCWRLDQAREYERNLEAQAWGLPIVAAGPTAHDAERLNPEAAQPSKVPA